MLSANEQATINALESAKIALSEACENYKPGQGAIVRGLMGNALCEAIEGRFAGLLLDARLGLETHAAAIRAVPLADFAEAAEVIELVARDCIIVEEGTFPWGEMVTAIVRETVARCFGPAADALAVDTAPPRPLMVPCPHCADSRDRAQRLPHPGG